MSIVSSDLVIYNSANMPVSDSGLSGGAIDTLRRPDFTQMASTDTVRMVSSNAGDTMNMTITGRLADGSVVTETLALNGTTVVTFANTYERFLKAELASAPAGNVTVARTTGPTTIRIIPAAERGFQAFFQQDASDPSVQKDYYMKTFWKNTNGSLALTSAVVKENADPSGLITFGLAASLNDSATTTNRITAPGGIVFASTAVNVPNSQNLSSGSAIGQWYDLTLAAGNAAVKSTYTPELDGNTT